MNHTLGRLVTAVTAVTVVTLGGCVPPTRTTVISTAEPAEYPCVLHPPQTIAHDFMVRQTIAIHAMHEGKPVDGELEAVLQKQGDTLLIIGFGPMNVKAFTLTQRGAEIELAQFVGPELPFSPRNVIVDVHRILFKRLPPPTEPGYSGVLRGELDDETVEETWQGGELRATAFTRPGSAFTGAVRIELGAGCTPARCEPVSAALTNEWFDYSLTITNQAYERL